MFHDKHSVDSGVLSVNMNFDFVTYIIYEISYTLNMLRQVMTKEPECSLRFWYGKAYEIAVPFRAAHAHCL